MKKILLSIFLMGAIIASNKLTAQCDLALANLVITPQTMQSAGVNKCQYTFDASFDIVTNSGFKYLFFHSWLLEDYDNNHPIFDCSQTNKSQDPGTSVQLGTSIDQVGKSFLDVGFINLNTVNFPANTPVDVTNKLATTYPNDNTVILNTAQNVMVKRKGSSDTLHFDVSGITIIVNKSCMTPISVKTDIWGSNANSPTPKAQCFICGIGQSFNDPFIALQKKCAASPFGYEVAITTATPTDMHIVYKVYMDDLDGIKEPGTDDPLIYTSDPIVINSNTPYNSGVVTLPNPYCCVDPWSQWGIYVLVTAQEFTNAVATPVVEEACATLPIKLKSFTATRSRSNVSLKWETEIEENNRGFDVQRKFGNGIWQTVGFVASKAYLGNSNTPLSYELSDFNGTNGVTQYRLKQIDIDGKSAFSVIRSVRGEGQKADVIVYPNPTNDGRVNIVFDDANVIRDVSVLDMSGRMIKQWKGITNNNIQIDNLNAGLYTVRIVNTETGAQEVQKFVVNKR